MLVQDNPSPFQLLDSDHPWPADHMLATLSDLAVITARWAGIGPRRNSVLPVEEISIAELAGRLGTDDLEAEKPSEPWGGIHLATASGRRLDLIWTPISGFYRITPGPEIATIDPTPVPSHEVWNEIVELCQAAAEPPEDGTWRGTAAASDPTGG